MPPTGVAMTGMLAAMASMNELPKPSDNEGLTKISEICRYDGIPDAARIP